LFDKRQKPGPFWPGFCFFGDAPRSALPDSAGSWAMVRDNGTGLIWEIKTNKDGTKNYTNPHDADNT
jgi:hypothetical protein